MEKQAVDKGNVFRAEIVEAPTFRLANIEQSAMRFNEIAQDKQATPRQIMAAFTQLSNVKQLLSSQAVREGYSLEEHTTMVITQFEKYFGNLELPAGVSRATFRKILCLHDLGKGLSVVNSDQLENTMRLLDLYLPHLHMDEREQMVARLIISADVMGKFVLGITSHKSGGSQPTIKTKLEAAYLHTFGYLDVSYLKDFEEQVSLASSDAIVQQLNGIRNFLAGASKASNIDIRDILELLTIYYQSDISAYTLDAERHIDISVTPGAHIDRNLVLSADGQLLPFSEIAASKAAGNSFYAYLEDLARVQSDSPNARFGYPSLDFLLAGAGCSELYTSPRFIKHTTKNRLLFSRPIEEVYERILE